MLTLNKKTEFLDSEKKKPLLSKITSSDCLKIVFSYIREKKTLEIIRYNNKLQRRLDKTKKDYNQICVYSRYSYLADIFEKNDFLHHSFFFERNVILLNCSMYLIIFIASIILMSIPFNLFFNNNSRNLNDLINNWKISPIKNIDFNNSGDLIIFGHFQSIQKEVPDICYDIDDYSYGCTKTISAIGEKDFIIWENHSFYVERFNNLKYKDIIDNKKGNKTFCGYDSRKNKLYFENECPINYIEITNNTVPSKKLNFTTIKLNDLKYLHYTNEYIEGNILIDLKVSAPKGICDYRHSINELKYYFKDYGNLGYGEDGCYNNLYDFSYNKIDHMIIYDFLEQNELNNTEEYLKLDTDIYLYSRAYKGIKSPSKRKIKFVIQNYKLFNIFLFIFLFYIGQNLSLFILYFLFLLKCFYALKFTYSLTIFILVINFIEIIFIIIDINIYYIVKTSSDANKKVLFLGLMNYSLNLFIFLICFIVTLLSNYYIYNIML